MNILSEKQQGLSPAPGSAKDNPKNPTLCLRVLSKHFWNSVAGVLTAPRPSKHQARLKLIAPLEEKDMSLLN